MLNRLEVEMVNNYVKPSGPRRVGRHHFITFDDTKLGAAAVAIAKVRELSGFRAVAVWRPLDIMPPDVYCVGHAPEEEREGAQGELLGHTCANCGTFHPRKRTAV
jgi:hypothetical protein